jgi:hypothetical protein
MGFATMTVMDLNDGGRGPNLEIMISNPRPIDEAFLATFAENTKDAGLHNLVSDNALVIGVKREYIQAASLQPIKLGVFENRVQWTEDARKEGASMLLFNGNHRRTYMLRMGPAVQAFQLFKKAEADLADAPPNQQSACKAVKTKAWAEVEASGRWLVKWIDEGKHENKSSSSYFY